VGEGRLGQLDGRLRCFADGREDWRYLQREPFLIPALLAYDLPLYQTLKRERELAISNSPMRRRRAAGRELTARN